VVTAVQWTHAYSRQQAAFPVTGMEKDKYWPAVARVDNVYGDRNLFCSCVPVEGLDDADACAVSA
jgi:glycine dehydrogenase